MANKLKISVALNALADTRGFKAFNNEMRQIQRAMNRLQPTLKVVTSALKSMGLAAGVAGTALRSIGGAVIAHAAQVDKLSKALGISTQAIQVLGDLAAQTGAKTEDMAAALKKLQKSVEQAAGGNKQLQERFSALGIDFDKFRAMKPERQMERLAIAVRGAVDQQQAQSDLMALVGEQVAGTLTGALDKLATQGFDAVAKSAHEAGVVMDKFSVEQLAQAERDIARFTTKLKVAFADVVTAPQNIATLLYGDHTKWEALDAASAKYGRLSRNASAAAREVSELMLKQGQVPIAAQVAKQAQAYAAAAQLALDEWARLDKSVNTTQADIVEFRQRNAELLAGGIQGTLQELAEIEKLLGKINDARTAVAAHEATLAAAAEERARVTGRGLGAPASSKSVLAEWAHKDREALNALGTSITAGLAKMDDEVAAAKDRLLEQVGSIEFAQLTEGEQLLSQTEQVKTQLEQFYQAGVLGAGEYARAQDALAAQMQRVDKLLRDEQNELAFESLNVGLQELVRQFEHLDGVIEGQLSGTIKDFVETGTADMKKLGQSIINEVIQSMIKALVLKPLLTGLGGLFGGNASGFFSGLGGATGLPSLPGRASGGPVTGARAYIVGEKGPELFIPPVSGQVIDANKTAVALAADTAPGGDRGAQNIYQIDARGADAGAVQRLEYALMRLAGPGVVERRARASEADRTRRG